MNLPEATKSGIKKAATFSGRASRAEYWYFVLFTILVSFAAGFVLALSIGANASTDQLNHATLVLRYVLYAVFFLPTLSLAVRRIHDTGRSGWFVLIPIYSFVLMFFQSDPNDNQYGPVNPIE